MMELPLNEKVEPEVDYSQRTVRIAVGKSARDPKPETVNLTKTQLWNQQNQLMLMHLTTNRMLEQVLQRTMYELELGLQQVVQNKQRQQE